MKKILLTLACSAMLLSGANADATKEAIQIQNAFSEVADKAFPAVVVIDVSKTIKSQHSIPQLPPEFEYFFGPRRFFQRPQRVPDREVKGSGSGFIINKEGYIVTNHHVVGGSDRITVQFEDKREYEAKLIGSDPKSDLAVIKIDVDEDLPYLELADSNKVRVGHWAIAIGAPFDMDYSMTVGVVSQKSRAVGLNIYENYIQTDASINPGNSGGPLLNIEGKVIGVNDFIISPNGGQGGNIGLGFAIPSNMAKSIISQLIEEGKVSRPWIGIAMQDLDEKIKKHLDVDKGVLVREVFSGNPADEYGMKPGDVIIKVGDEEVNSSHDLQFAILKFKPGEMIPMEIVRDGDVEEIKVKAGRQKDDEVAGENLNDWSKVNNKLLSDYGLELTEEREELIVSKVISNSSADISGVVKGMQIIAVNKRKVESIKDLKKILKNVGDTILLYLSDGRSNFFVVLNK